MFIWQGGNDSAEGGLFSRQDRLQATHRIQMEVEAIGDVECLGCSMSNRISKGQAAVARDDLHTGMVTEPSGDCLHLAVG